MHCGSADGRSGPAVLAACAARRWLARSAADVKLLRNKLFRNLTRSRTRMAAPACTSLVSCLPALEDVTLMLCAPLDQEDLGCLLEVLAWCPGLRALDLYLSMPGFFEGHGHLHWPFPEPDLAKLRSLTSLALRFDASPYELDNVVDALVSLTGLVELCIKVFRTDEVQVVPAALGQLKALRSLELTGMSPYILEAGCLDLPALQSMAFSRCMYSDAEVLPGVTALQCLTRIEFSCGLGPFILDPQLEQLPGLQRLVFSQRVSRERNPPGPLQLPADMGALSVSLLHLDISGHMGTRFPIALTQLGALEHLNAEKSEFTELPAGITALSRLTQLILGRMMRYDEDPLQLRGKRPLNVRALRDLSGFPALRKVTFAFCEVMLSPSVLGTVQHTSLTSLCFHFSHPAPECAPAVLQLSRELLRLRRGSVLKAVIKHVHGRFSGELRGAQGRAPCQMFVADLEACRLEACGL